MAKRATNRRRQPRLDVPTVEEQSPGARNAVDFVQRRHDMLDKSRSFGTVTGDFFVDGKRVHYEVGQGPGRLSKLYDNELRRIYREGERENEEAEAGRRNKPRQAAPPASDEEEKMPAPPEQDFADPDDEDDDEREEAPPPMQGVRTDTSVQFVDGVDSGDDVNLSAWALYQVQYRFALVRQAIDERYHRAGLANEAEARDFLIEVGLVSGAEVEAASKG